MTLKSGNTWHEDILRVIGWNPIIQYKTPITDKWVGCLSHTAGSHEFFLWLLYMKNNSIFNRSCLLMADNPKFEKFPYKQILDGANVIRLSADRWTKKQGYVSKIVDIINKKRYNICILAPSGKDKEPLPWKTGYYHIAKSLGWDLRVVGFDFEVKRLKVGISISSDFPIDVVQSFLQTEMADIVPLRPKNSWTTIRPYNKNKLSFVNINILFPFFIIGLLIWFILMKNYNIGLFHILVSIYGFFLQLHSNIFVKIVGYMIIYQHIFVIYLGYPRIPEIIIILGALSGLLIGIKNENALVYIPLIYSFRSNIPVYVTDLYGQFRVILLTIIISICIGEHISNKKYYNIKEKS